MHIYVCVSVYECVHMGSLRRAQSLRGRRSCSKYFFYLSPTSPAHTNSSGCALLITGVCGISTGDFRMNGFMVLGGAADVRA